MLSRTSEQVLSYTRNNNNNNNDPDHAQQRRRPPITGGAGSSIRLCVIRGYCVAWHVIAGSDEVAHLSCVVRDLAVTTDVSLRKGGVWSLVEAYCAAR